MTSCCLRRSNPFPFSCCCLLSKKFPPSERLIKNYLCPSNTHWKKKISIFRIKQSPMYICQWSLEIIFGKQKQALDIMKEWGAEKFRSSNFKKSKNRVYVGHI